MPAIRLTDIVIKSKTAAKGQTLSIADAGCPGLELRVYDTGVRSFAFRYRQGSRVSRKTIGRYPDVTLAQARDRVAELRRAHGEGLPIQSLSAAAAPSGETAIVGIGFADAAARYIDEYAKPRKSSWKNDEGYLRRGPVEAWGRRPLNSITDDDCAALLERLARHSGVNANRTQSVLHKLFQWAREPGRKWVKVNPMAGMRRQAEETPRDRVLSDAELRTFWQGVDKHAEPTIATALKLILATARRPGEVAGMMRAELQVRGSRGDEWHVPAARMKNRKPFICPLSGLAVRLVRSILPAGSKRLVVFDSDQADTLQRRSLSQALTGNDGRPGICAALGLEPFTPHDLRRTAATLARRAGADRDAVSALLSHTKDDVTAIYDRYDMLAEKRAAAEILERELERLGLTA